MLAGKQWFSTLDLASGYWQVFLSQEAKIKTAFATHSGLFQFRVMPFGLCNTPATFEILMDRVLQGLRWSCCLVYLDDIISFGSTFDDALVSLTLTLDYNWNIPSVTCFNHLHRSWATLLAVGDWNVIWQRLRTSNHGRSQIASRAYAKSWDLWDISDNSSRNLLTSLHFWWPWLGKKFRSCGIRTVRLPLVLSGMHSYSRQSSLFQLKPDSIFLMRMPAILVWAVYWARFRATLSAWSLTVVALSVPLNDVTAPPSERCWPQWPCVSSSGLTCVAQNSLFVRIISR